MVLLLLSACAPVIERHHWYANKLSSNISLAKHTAYFRSEYASTTKNEADWAYRAIHQGEQLAAEYDLILYMLEKDETSQSVISDIKTFREILDTHLAIYSDVWSKAINDHVESEYSNVDFDIALYITKKEYSRIGVFSKVSSIKEKIKQKVANFDKHKYQRTYELYAIVSQLVAFAEEPKGSLRTFSSTVNRLNTDFSKTLALAELEF